MRNFSSLHNRHRDAEGRLEEQRMLYFQRIEVDILNQCSQRFVSSPISCSFSFQGTMKFCSRYHVEFYMTVHYASVNIDCFVFSVMN